MVKTFTTFITLGTTFTPVLSPRKTQVTPARSTYWDVLRLWCYSIGYESLADGTGPFASATNDPYFTQHGQGNNTIDTQPCFLNLYAAFYRDSIQLDKLLQPYFFVPRSFEPIVLQQPLRFLEGQNVIMFAAELPGQATTYNSRRGRGIAFGFDYEEKMGQGL